MLDPTTVQLCVWRLSLEAGLWSFSKLDSLGHPITHNFNTSA
jgi:hypothetical protein